MTYLPSQEILDKYADLMVNFCLGGGEGVKPGDVVELQGNEDTKPLFLATYRAILKAGAHAVMTYIPNGSQSIFFEEASDDQIGFFPLEYRKGLYEIMDHRLRLYSEYDKFETTNVAPEKMMNRLKAFGPEKKMMLGKENAGELSWSLCLYPSHSMASDAGMSLEAYWQEIIHACYLDADDPKAEWARIFNELETTRQRLSDLKIQSVHMTGEDCDLTVQLGSYRQWLAGSGCNMPSYEIFTSPDWRGTEGWIRFNQPLSYQGSIIKGIELGFKEGRVVSSKATQGEALLKEMIAQENADKVGEYSLTDGRISRITKYMGETLYDENVGGPFGNTHLALGSAYRDAYTGDVAGTSEEQWEDLGFNESIVHTDIMSTTDRTVEATLENGEKKVIYKDGKFTI